MHFTRKSQLAPLGGRALLIDIVSPLVPWRSWVQTNLFANSARVRLLEIHDLDSGLVWLLSTLGMPKLATSWTLGGCSRFMSYRSTASTCGCLLQMSLETNDVVGVSWTQWMLMWLFTSSACFKCPYWIGRNQRCSHVAWRSIHMIDEMTYNNMPKPVIFPNTFMYVV